MKLLLADSGSCGVNYQADLIIEYVVAMQKANKDFEFTKKVEEADVIVILGTCCCTESKLYETVNFIKDILKDKKSTAKTYLTGCISRGLKENPKLKDIENYLSENIDYIVNHNEPIRLIKLLNDKTKLDPHEYGMFDYDEDFADIYMQNGCTNNCTFCKSNYLKMNLKDTFIEEVKDAIDEIDKEGVSTVQLRGLNIAQYGLGLYRDYKLMDICEYIEDKKNIKKVILSGFAFSDAIKGNFAKKLKYLEKTLCIVGSLESGSNRILKLMNKGFTVEEFLNFYDEINSIYNKDFWFNIISGFPTETKEDCLKTLEILKKIKPELVNINTYSDSIFIPSHNFEQLSDREIREHTKIYSKVLKNNKIPFQINGAN